MAVATTLIEQPQRLPTQRVVKATPFFGEFVGSDALVVRGATGSEGRKENNGFRHDHS
jgi:hypothetical protein